MSHSFGFSYASRLKIEAWEEAPLTWSDKDMAGVYAPYYDRLKLV